MKLLRTLAVASTSAVLIMGQAVAAFACEQHETAALTAPARSATAKYHSLTVAKKAGYSILADTAGITCIAEPQMGAMGVHYVKGDLVKNPAIDATYPEALVYAPDRHGQPTPSRTGVCRDQVRLGIQPAASQASEAGLLRHRRCSSGRCSNFTDAPNRYGLPPFYSLHAWIWKDNPAGTFEMWNPNVHCDET